MIGLPLAPLRETVRVPVQTLPRLKLITSPAWNVVPFTLASDFHGAEDDVPMFESEPPTLST